MKILAVDDDFHIRELLPMILEEAGFSDVTVANSAKSALSTITAQTEPFECFCLDIQMPGGSGIELCADIRALPAHRKTPIIMLTAMHERSFIDDAFAAGATDYATKPFDFKDLCARIRVAKLLVEEQRRVRQLSSQLDGSGIIKLEKTDADFAERFDLGELKGLVSTHAFENYLSQLSRIGIQSLFFFAVHVQNGRDIFSRSTSSEFEYALQHVADAIIASYRSGAVVMSYVGSGNFICTSKDAILQSTEQVENGIQDIIDEKQMTYEDGSPLDIEIATGSVVQPLISQPLKLADLEAQAVKRALARVREKSAQPRPVNIRRVSF